jgi:hypothetical protein
MPMPKYDVLETEYTYFEQSKTQLTTESYKQSADEAQDFCIMNRINASSYKSCVLRKQSNVLS